MDPPPPLAEFSAYLDGPTVDPVTEAAKTERHNNIQNAIAECMAAEAFRYVPTPLSSQVDIMEDRLRPSALLPYLPVAHLADERDVVAREGYGLMPTPEVRDAAEGYSSDDPNAAYLSTLSPAEADAYSRALFGDYDAPDLGAESAHACSGQAVSQYPEPTELDRQQVFQSEYFDLINAATVGVMDALFYDPRRVQLDD